MPKRDSTVNTVKSTTVRRSPRLLRQKTPGQGPPMSVRKSPRHTHQRKSAPEPQESKSTKSRSHSVRRWDSLLSLNKDSSETASKKLSESHEGLRNRGKLSTGSNNSPIFYNGVDGFSSLRRSSRISDKRNVRAYEDNDFPERVLKKAGDSGDGARKRANLSSGSIKSQANNGVDGCQSLRRSQRLSNQQLVVHEHTEKSSRVKCYRLSSNSKSKEEPSDVRRAETGVKSGENSLVKGKRATKREAEEFDGGSRVVEVSKKRKRDEEGNGTVQGWTKEQELALQRAYLATKPTPHFWKKVSKLVPGKSAQDCFDKVNSDHLTPPQRHPVSRAKRIRNSSPIQHLQLSASKLLKPTKPKVNRPTYNKEKSHVMQKNIRHLLQTHYHQNQDHEADLFSVLEPNFDLSTQALHPGIIFSTPKNLHGKQGLIQKCNGRSSSGHKNPLSRFSGSCGKALASPPVLKQVKNKVLHEKYIDRLHSRDAKRKAASELAKKSTFRMERKESHIQKSDVVRYAKNALVSDAISMLQHMKTNAMSSGNSSDLDDDLYRSDDESENGI